MNFLWCRWGGNPLLVLVGNFLHRNFFRLFRNGWNACFQRSGTVETLRFFVAGDVHPKRQPGQQYHQGPKLKTLTWTNHAVPENERLEPYKITPIFGKSFWSKSLLPLTWGFQKWIFTDFSKFFFPLLSPHLTMNQALPVGGLGTLTNLFPKAQVAFTDGHISEYKLEALLKVLKTLAVGMGRNVNKRCGLIRTGFPTKNIGSMGYGKFTYTWMVRWFLW